MVKKKGFFSNKQRKKNRQRRRPRASNATWARLLRRGPVKGCVLREAHATLGQPCSIQFCKDFQSDAARTQPRQIPARELDEAPGSASSSSRFQRIGRIHPHTPSIRKKNHHLICLSPTASPDSRFGEDSSLTDLALHELVKTRDKSFRTSRLRHSKLPINRAAMTAALVPCPRLGATRISPGPFAASCL
jgi:hypothetical protein